MTNKRQLKKYVHYVCGDLAAEIILARRLFDGYDNDAVNNIIIEIAALQETTIANVSFDFDKVAKDFESRAAYHKALRAYNHTAYGKLVEDFHKGVGEIVKKMNEITPQQVRDTFKYSVEK